MNESLEDVKRRTEELMMAEGADWVEPERFSKATIVQVLQKFSFEGKHGPQEAVKLKLETGEYVTLRCSNVLTALEEGGIYCIGYCGKEERPGGRSYHKWVVLKVS